MSQTEAWRPLDLVRWTADYFARHGVATPRLDAELLLAHVLGTQRLDLYLRWEEPVSPADRERFRGLVRQRARERVPVAYLIGRREFWSRSFRVTRAVLIPRPESETLVEAVVARRPGRLAEVGTGSGALAGAIAVELPAARIVSVERCPRALAVARENLERLGVAERVWLCRADALEALRGPFEVIVSNPPYVRRDELSRLAPEVLHEPRLALDGGEDGLDGVRALVRGAPRCLAGGGVLIVEVGEGQAAAASQLMRDAGAVQIEVRKDLAGVERVLEATFAGGEEQTWTAS